MSLSLIHYYTDRSGFPSSLARSLLRVRNTASMTSLPFTWSPVPHTCREVSGCTLSPEGNSLSRVQCLHIVPFAFNLRSPLISKRLRSALPPPPTSERLFHTFVIQLNSLVTVHILSWHSLTSYMPCFRFAHVKV